MRKIIARVDRLQRLAVFESAGRLGSFSAAAGELGMTQPAVTRHIRSLETAVGHELFVRSSNRSRLNDAGAILLQSVQSGFESIESGIERVDQDVETFELATGPSMAHFILVPMLDKLQEAVGAIDIRMTLLDGRGTFDRPRYDAVTELTKPPDPGAPSALLFPEVVVPVASPALASRLGLCKDSSPSDLVAAPRIHEVQGYREWMSWDGWFRTQGVDLPDRQRRILLSSHPLVIQQAIAGQGIALGWRYLVDDAVAKGQLVHVGKESPTGKGFYLNWTGRGSVERCKRVASAISSAAQARVALTNA